MNDFIDRQNAIDVFEILADKMSDEGRTVMTQAISVLRDLPSVWSEQKWIPFGVALPNDRQKVLCINKHGEMMIGGYMSDYGMTFPCYFGKVVAWMPLPESYKGD